MSEEIVSGGQPCAIAASAHAGFLFADELQRRAAARAARALDGRRQAVKDADPNWEPLPNTPPHPDYVSGHCIVSGATAEVVRLLLKDDGVPFTATYAPPGTGLTRSFASLTQAEKAIGNARVWAGIHTRTADHHGAIVGHKIAELVVQRAMKPN
jgi:hypothetical protein